jgi:primosomal protein N'
MIATVIPSLRTPRGITGFDYEIPDGMDVTTGDLVRIPFRKRELVGVISSVHETSERKTPLKFLSGSFHDLHVPDSAIQLLFQLSERSFTSPPTVLHAWLGVLPKRIPKASGTETIVTKKDPPSSPSVGASTCLFITDRLNHPDGLIAQAHDALRNGKQILILTPWAARAEQIARQFDTTAMTSEASAGKRFTCWHDFAKRKTPVLVATRIGAWCGAYADILLIDEPENDDHKQDELSPRYDARWIAAFLHSKGKETHSIGTTPRLNQLWTKEITSSEVIPEIRPNTIYVDTHYADWSEIPGIQGRSLIAMEQAIQRGSSCMIIHPIFGEDARLRCKDCGWSATCEACGASTLVQERMLICRRCHHKHPLILECPSCGGTTFAKSKPGRIRLADSIASKALPGTTVLSVGEWNALPPIPENSFVLLTDLALLAGAREDLRRTEQMIIAWRRLADRCAAHHATLAVQGDPELLSHARIWLQPQGCFEAFQRELKERECFGLPPTKRLVKLIFRGNQGHAERVLEELTQQIRSLPQAALSGPFTVRYRPSHRESRWISHLSVPLSVPIQEVIRSLSPMALRTDTLIDLDPIAFFE